MHLQILPDTSNRNPYGLDFYYVSILQRCKWQLLMSGEEVMLYQRRWTGTRCPNYSQIKKQHAVDTDLDNCFATGWVGGYYRPIKVFVSFMSPVLIENIVREEGVKKSFQPKSWSLHEPNFKNGDFILRQNGERLWMVNITPTRWRSKILRQLFDLDLVEKNHPIYTIPV